MSANSESPDNPIEHPATDYAFLRREGIRHIERMAGHLWTDYNAHDPGITILEQLCYAVTDLGYRIGYEIPDLLASGGDDPYRSLYGPADILASHPVTLTDLRKAALDVRGVRNAWIEKAEEPKALLFHHKGKGSLSFREEYRESEPVYLKGLYRVSIEADGRDSRAGAPADGDIRLGVARRLHANRGLCEDFEAIEILSGQEIGMEAEIEIGPVDDAAEILREIYSKIDAYLSPPVSFSALGELLDSGKPVEKIFEGPRLEKGFLDSEALGRSMRRTSLYTSHLIREMMDVRGVRAVKSIAIYGNPKGSAEKWRLELDEGKAPRLGREDLKITMMRKGVSAVSAASGGESVEAARDQAAAASERSSSRENDLAPPPWRDRNVGGYYSIQHQFPACYGIGSPGLPASATPQRKAQAKQLKAYLMFFDQLLANYFAQLAHVRDLFSFDDEPEVETYFSQSIEDAALGLDEILDNGVVKASKEEEKRVSLERKNRFLSHLLARLAEHFTDYSLLLFSREGDHLDDLIQTKKELLKSYPRISSARGSGFNCLESREEVDGRLNLSGLQERLRFKLGLGKDEELHLVEHILLRPQEEDKQQRAPILSSRRKDPYSLQLSLVLPEKPDKDGNEKERLERTVREETPAHLTPYVRLLGNEEMEKFKRAHKGWRRCYADFRTKSLETGEPPEKAKYSDLRDFRDQLIELLEIGKTFPRRDVTVKVQNPMVAFQERGRIIIEDWQPGVTYRLCDVRGNSIPGREASGIETEDFDVRLPLTLETPEIEKDVTFKILAAKPDSDPIADPKAYLLETVSIKVGIDARLEAHIEAALLDESVTAYANTDAPRLISYEEPEGIRVYVEKSQAGIRYRLVASREGDVLEDEALSAYAPGNGGRISLTIPADELTEDLELRIKANRVQTTEEPLLDAVLPLKVRANPKLEISVDPPVADYRQSVRIKIAGAQKSAVYQAHARPIRDSELVRLISGKECVHDVSEHEYRRRPISKQDLLGVAARDLWTPKPKGEESRSDIPAGFEKWGAPVRGDGGGISLSLDNLEEDCVVIVTAAKEHQAKREDCSATIISSAVRLEQAVAVLVRPNPEAPVTLEMVPGGSGRSSIIRASGGQPGVFYELRRSPADQEPIRTVYFCKQDESDSSIEKGIGQLAVEVDFVIASDASLCPEGPCFEAGSLTVGSVLYVRARKAQTAIAIDFGQPVTIG